MNRQLSVSLARCAQAKLGGRPGRRPALAQTGDKRECLRGSSSKSAL